LYRLSEGWKWNTFSFQYDCQVQSSTMNSGG
jgi:hypothetical protein